MKMRGAKAGGALERRFHPGLHMTGPAKPERIQDNQACFWQDSPLSFGWFITPQRLLIAV
jgi:hypothetical protein